MGVNATSTAVWSKQPYHFVVGIMSDTNAGPTTLVLYEIKRFRFSFGIAKRRKDKGQRRSPFLVTLRIQVKQIAEPPRFTSHVFQYKIDYPLRIL